MSYRKDGYVDEFNEYVDYEICKLCKSKGLSRLHRLEDMHKVRLDDENTYTLLCQECTEEVADYE